jgi:hypothetical protein
MPSTAIPNDAIPNDAMVTNMSNSDELLHTLLEICEDFFGRTSPATRSELDTLLLARGIYGGPGWLIDMLGLTRLRLQQPTSHDGPHPRHST